MTRAMVEVSSVVGNDVTGNGTREHPFATLERAKQVASLIEAVEGQRPIISYDGLLGTMVPAAPPAPKRHRGDRLALGLLWVFVALGSAVLLGLLGGLLLVFAEHPKLLAVLIAAVVIGWWWRTESPRKADR